MPLSAGQDFYRSCRRDRGSHRRGVAPQPARYVCILMDELRGPSEELPRSSRRGARVAPSLSRPTEICARPFFVGRRLGAPWSMGRGAFRGRGRSGARSGFSPSPVLGPAGRRCSTTRVIQPGSRAASNACAWRGCRSNDRDPPPRRDHGRRRRRLSRLMGEDEAGTARAVREHREAARPIVAGQGGRIGKTMGDGLLLEFSLCRRRRRVRHCDPSADGRAQRGRSRGQARRLPHRRQPRRRADRGRRQFSARASTSRRGSRAFASRAAC